MFNYLSFLESVSVLFVSSLPAVLIAVLYYTVFYILVKLGFIISGKHFNIRLWKLSGIGVPSVIVAIVLFLLVDNFANTFFGQSSLTYDGILSRAYFSLMFFLFTYYSYNKLVNIFVHHDGIHLYIRNASVVALLLSFLFSFYGTPLTAYKYDVHKTKQGALSKLPNIIFFNADGVNAASMSVYGHEVKNTPFLESIESESMIAHHHFTNSAKTTGSVGALLSGKHPLATKVVFRPDTFLGNDMFEHYPRVLKSFGYYNIDISIRHYVDAVDLKIRNAFDYANNRHVSGVTGIMPEWFLLRWPSTTHFIEETFNRLVQRFAHNSGLDNVSNPYGEVTQSSHLTQVKRDVERMEQLKHFIEHAPQPYFISLHLMGPHGRRFEYEHAEFTETKEQAFPWMKSHYDNAIYQWDQYASQVYDMLSLRDELEKTILVFNSDHGWQHSINNALPLIIRFPHSAHSGVVKLPSQRLDIMPTIMDYLGVNIPAWSEGYSLLNKNRRLYPIFIVSSKKTKMKNRNEWKVAYNPQPPFYSLGSVSMLDCGVLFRANIENETIAGVSHTERVHRPPDQCGDELVTNELATDKILRKLKDMNYEFDSSLIVK